MFRDIWQLSKSALKERRMDVHTRLMSKYKRVPEWWFVCILLTSIGATIFACEYYNDQLQLPWWGVLLGCAVSIFFTLPIGIIAATTNQVIPASSIFFLMFFHRACLFALKHIGIHGEMNSTQRIVKDVRGEGIEVEM